MGVAVTFIAILELVREGLIDIVQQEPFASIHVRTASAARRLRVVSEEPEVEAVVDTPIVAVADEDFDDDDDDDSGADGP